MPIERVKKTRVKNAKRYEIYHSAVMPEFLIADSETEAVEVKRELEKRHGGEARIQDLKSRG
jgi:hypothetical protein